jgi:hypothetical protein
MDRMTPPEEHHPYREQVGAFLLGKLDEGERTDMQTHLNSCPVCQAEVRELQPVVAALADAVPDRIDDDPLPPGDLEELTLAPIMEEIHFARRRRRRFQWSALAAAAICVVVVGLAGFTWLLEPAVALVEPVPFSVAPGMEVEGHLIAHAWGTEIRLLVSGLRDGQTYKVTLVSEDGERVNSGTFIGIGDKPLSCTFNAALLRKEANRLEVRTTPGGELVSFAKLPEEPRDKVRDWPLFGTLPWAGPDLQRETTGSSGPQSMERPTQKKPKNAGSWDWTPPKGSSPEGGGKGLSPRGEKPGPAPKVSEPGALPEPPSYEPPPPDQPPPEGQYRAQP